MRRRASAGKVGLDAGGGGAPLTSVGVEVVISALSFPQRENQDERHYVVATAEKATRTRAWTAETANHHEWEQRGQHRVVLEEIAKQGDQHNRIPHARHILALPPHVTRQGSDAGVHP